MPKPTQENLPCSPFSQVPFCGITLIYVVYRHIAMWTFYFLPLTIWLLWLLHRTRFTALACQWLACSTQSSVLECRPCHSVFLNPLSREQPCCTCAAVCLSVFWWAPAICMEHLSCGQYWCKRISSRHYFDCWGTPNIEMPSPVILFLILGTVCEVFTHRYKGKFTNSCTYPQITQILDI